MDKYSKTLMMLLKIPLGIFYILVGAALIGVSVWVSTFSDIASMILLMALLGGGAVINLGVGYAFLGDEYKATSTVRGGDTRFAPVLTPQFLTRRKIVTLVGAIAYVVLALFYVVRAIFGGAWMLGIPAEDYDTNVVALIIYAVLSLFVAFFLFILYKKTKHEDLGEPENE